MNEVNKDFKYFKALSFKTNSLCPIILYEVDSFYQNNIAACADYLMDGEIPVFSKENLLNFLKKVINSDFEKNRIENIIEPEKYKTYLNLIEDGFAIKDNLLLQGIQEEFIGNLEPITPLHIDKNTFPLWSVMLRYEFFYSDLKITEKLKRLLDEEYEKDLLKQLNEKTATFDNVERDLDFCWIFKEIPIDTPLKDLLNTKIAATKDGYIYNGSVLMYKSYKDKEYKNALGVMFPNLSSSEDLSEFSQLFKVELSFKK